MSEGRAAMSKQPPPSAEAFKTAKRFASNGGAVETCAATIDALCEKRVSAALEPWEQLRRTCAQMLGCDTDWPQHGNAPLAIASALQLRVKWLQEAIRAPAERPAPEGPNPFRASLLVRMQEIQGEQDFVSSAPSGRASTGEQPGCGEVLEAAKALLRRYDTSKVTDWVSSLKFEMDELHDAVIKAALPSAAGGPSSTSNTDAAPAIPADPQPETTAAPSCAFVCASRLDCERNGCRIERDAALSPAAVVDYTGITERERRIREVHKHADLNTFYEREIHDLLGLLDERRAEILRLREQWDAALDAARKEAQPQPGVVDYTERARIITAPFRDGSQHSERLAFEVKDALSAVASERDNQVQGMAAVIATQKAFIDKFNEVYDSNSKIAEKIVAHHTVTPAIYGLQPDHRFKENASPLDVAADIASALSALSAIAFEHQAEITSVLNNEPGQPSNPAVARSWTPGPWRMIQPIALDYRVPLVYGANAETLIATAEGGGPRRAIDAAETRANALLIAAAPELYAALVNLLAESDPYRPGRNSHAELNARAAAVAALRKAAPQPERVNPGSAPNTDDPNNSSRSITGT